MFAAAPEQRRTSTGVDSEGYGVVSREAAAAGRCSPRLPAESPRRVIDGRTGMVLDVRDAGRYAEAVERLLADPELARRLGDNGRRQVRSGGGWRSTAEALLEIYRRLLGAGRLTPA